MIIEIKDLTKKIKGATVLDTINLQFESGKIYGLQGKNGSGKTMLMRAICGLIIPTSGEVRIDGKNLGREISFPESAGALIETPGFISNYTGLENLKAIASIKRVIGLEDIKNSLERVGLDPEDKRKYRKYSLGMKQRLGIAAAIMEKPALIILDEPTNALDENGVKLVRSILQVENERGALIIISCHDSEELEYLADEITVIENGQIKSTRVVENHGLHLCEGGPLEKQAVKNAHCGYFNRCRRPLHSFLYHN
jgi:ABC-type multidrug transport system, ATPase component